MDLAFGAGGDQYFAFCFTGLPDSLHLQGLTEGVAAGPCAIPTTYGAAGLVLHFFELLGVNPVDQFSREIRPVCKATQPAGILKSKALFKKLVYANKLSP